MPRPRCCRRIAGAPACKVFKPAGSPAASLEEVRLTLEEYEAIRLADRFRHSVAISAATGEGTQTLCQTIADLLRDRVAHLHLRIPATEGRLLAALHANGKVLEQKVSGKHLRIEAVLSSAFAATLDPKWIEP